MDALYAKFGTYRDDLWDYMRTAAKGKSARKVEKRRNELLKSTRSVKIDLMRMKPYEEDATLKEAAVTYMDLTYKILNEDYGKIVDLEEIAEESYDLMEAYLKAKELANDRLDEASDLLSDAQETFAASHNINLIEGEESKRDMKIRRASGVFEYYNQLYLIFFKSYKQEAYWLDAVNAQDVNAMVQNQGTLKKYAAEGLATLDTVRVYEADPSLINVTKDVLRFYVNEAEKATDFSAFYLEQANMERLQKAIEAKPQNKRTKEDIDAYNQAVQSFNAKLNAFNQTNEQLNKERGKVLDNWNKTADKFVSKHVN